MESQNQGDSDHVRFQRYPYPIAASDALLVQFGREEIHAIVELRVSQCGGVVDQSHVMGLHGAMFGDCALDSSCRKVCVPKMAGLVDVRRT